MSTAIFHRKFRAWPLALLAILCFTAASPAFSKSSFTLFESGQVRPLALSPDGKRLFAVNTPDNRLEIFDVSKHGLKRVGSVLVGLEPVAVAVRSNTEVWVVNHLSDSVSVVDLHKRHVPRVVRTLLVGDEPRDIVFAGLNRNRAFITTAHRGQNAYRENTIRDDPQLTTPGIGRADVWVFDADDLGDSLGGDEFTVITLFTDTPRALAASADGTTVYAAGFQTGNKTTAINEFLIREAISTPPFNHVYPEPLLNKFPVPEPLANHDGIRQPSVGLIVQHKNGHWVDNMGQIWDDKVPFDLPDQDVFTIDAMANPPHEAPNGTYSGVGTVLFNMIVNPINGHVYVGNTDAQNQERFEGAGKFLEAAGVFDRHTVRGHLHESRITVLNDMGEVKPRHLNKHIDYSKCCAPIPNQENDTSVAFPMAMAITSDGSGLYVPMFGTSEVAVYNTAQLEDDSFVPNTADQIPVSGGGPSGIVLDESRGRAYVMTRFDNAISVIDTGKRAETKHIAMHNPEPRHIVEGRRFLYDASFTSSHGDSACASCHVFGDFDSLAWDLGDPDHDETPNTGPFRLDENVGFFLSRALNPLTGKPIKNPVNPHFRPMKGPMATQSLRGLANHGSMHWRGDRTGGNDDNLLPKAGDNEQPNGGSFNEDVAFRKFNVAFVGLNGRHEPLSDKDMRKFADFMLETTYPPNPIRNLDNSLTKSQQRGREFYCGVDPASCIGGNKVDTFLTCNGCHTLNLAGNSEFPEVNKPGFFGTDGQFSFDGESQIFKIPHLRNLYQKVGMFGMAANPKPSFAITPPGSLFFLPLAVPPPGGPQVRGFGFLHDGSVDTLFRFVSQSLFLHRPSSPSLGVDPRTPKSLLDANGKDPGNLGGLPNPAVPGQDLVTLRRDIEAFLLAFDSNLKPIVGQQVTLTKQNGVVVGSRVDLLMAGADAHQCDLVAKNRFGGFLYVGKGKFRSLHHRFLTIPDALLRTSALLPDGEVTYTCTPPGSGVRADINRDGDGVFDDNDRDMGQD
jgi:DNA-binding beta-propeller fold protein YncE